MIRTFLTLTALLALTGGCLTSSQRTRQPAPSLQASQQGKVVYALRNIPKGSVIKPEDLKEQDIDTCKINQGSIVSVHDTFGKTARFDIHEGEQVGLYELKPLPQDMQAFYGFHDD
jgi:flagella basal body P-ring formation protein FlgA